MRRTTTVVVDAEGRDNGKAYFLTEMPAAQGEEWANRVMMALAKGGADLPPGVLDMGMAGVAFLGLSALAHIPWTDAKPLLDEMFQQVQLQPDPASTKIVRALVETDIEEIATRYMLRREVMRLHIGFFPTVGDLTSALTRATALLPSSSMETSPTA